MVFDKVKELIVDQLDVEEDAVKTCLLYTSPSPRD